MNKNDSKKENKQNDVCLQVVEKKLALFKDIIQKTIIHVQKNKMLDILGVSDVTTCIDRLNELSKKINSITEKDFKNTDTLINTLQNINNDISSIFKNYGTENLEDLLIVCFGNKNNTYTNEIDNLKFDLLKKYFHPTSYKLLNKKEDSKIKKSQEEDDNTSNMDCFDIMTNFKQYHMKVYGIKLFIHNETIKKSLVIYGILDDIIIDFLNNKYILKKQREIMENLPDDNEFHSDSFKSFVSSLVLKDYLIHNTSNEFYNKFIGYVSQNTCIKQKTISQCVKEFIADEMYSKRVTLIQLLIHSSNYENQYLAYLLYDLLSNDTNGNIDTQEQIILFDSFPWNIKQYFRDAMKKTIQYTNELSNFDINKIPLEQQICLLKASDSVKEKAMMKLKEVKSKSDDNGSKSRQYLDGLLKIPFGINKHEPILNLMDTIRRQFKEMYKTYDIGNLVSEIPLREKYTSIEMVKYMKNIKEKLDINNNTINSKLAKCKIYLTTGDKSRLNKNANLINEILKKYNFKDNKIKYNSLKKDELVESIESFIDLCAIKENGQMRNDVEEQFKGLNKVIKNNSIQNDILDINKNFTEITDYMTQVKNTLDKAVYGHDKAKKQIERIIAQWVNGEQHGYVFGFEGPPGVGKTSLAKKGLSDCLKDENGVSRPFSMIQMGGDSNGSTLHGHNYTYVGSTWGSIVQIIIDKKCMNPIIFIDEVDKISRTEHGKEIIGILTHLLDPAQNDCFQDKYFTGIDLDLSKALFILSYNDASVIDKILLDRVHRVKFNNLSLEDKLIISKTHILPEVYKKMGLEEMINFEDEVLKFIIDEYTCESGVRKLKEILFEIVGEINLDVLKNNNDYDLPIEISIDDIKKKYFKDKRENIIRKVPDMPLVGFINGMYATSLGTGGTLPIHAMFYPSDKFLDLKLTGLQQEVMKESMHVALTIAWNMTPNKKQKEIRKKYDTDNNKCGINIHAGDLDVQKEGPSAGCAITCVLYSLLNNIPIKPEIAITGEIQMSGNVTAIGGLNHKILGSIKAGVKIFLYPKENQKDFDEFYEKYKNDERLESIKFYCINHVNEALGLIIEK